MAKVYVFDNNTGADIPSKIDIYPVELILGSTVSEVHDKIQNNTKLFCVFTNVKNSDFVVDNEKDVEILKSILKFGHYNYTVEYKKSSVWFSDKSEKNIIISSSVDIDSFDISSLLGLFMNKASKKEEIKKELYSVINTRNNRILYSTPILKDATNKCDANPCSIVVKKSTKEIIYKSRFGKVSIPYTKENVSSKMRVTLGVNLTQ